MLTNFIYSQSKGLFLEHLQAGNVPEDAIAFLEDSGEIWNRNHYFGSTGVSNLLTEGKLIGTITANNNPYNIYAPDTYAWSEITGRPVNLSAFNDDIVAGKYLPITGGTLKSYSTDIVLKLNSNRTEDSAWIEYNSNDVRLGYIGFKGINTPVFYPTSGTAKYLLHSGNYSDLIGNTYLKTDGSNKMMGRLYMNSHAIEWDMNDTFQLLTPYNANDYKLSYYDGSSWKTIAFTDSTVAAAKKLTTDSHVYASFSDTGKYLLFGATAAEQGYNTYVDGYNIYFRYGGGYTSAMTITEEGRVLINSSSAIRDRQLSIENGGIFVGAIPDASPALGSVGSNSLLVGATTYGMQHWVLGNGQGNIQAGRFDGTATAYALNLNPLGGAVNVGSVGSTTNILGAATIGNKDESLVISLKSSSNSYIWDHSPSGALFIGLGNLGSVGSNNASLAITPYAVFGGYRNNAVDLGLASYRWRNVYSVLGNFSSRVVIGETQDDNITKLQVAGDTHIKGNLKVDGEINSIGGLSTTEDLLSYGVEWDTTQSTPDCVRIGNPLLHKSLPIQSKLRGCVANGNNINYYLYSEDWAYKEDGTTPSVLDGTDGTVRVDTGAKFYIKSGSNGTKRWVRISTIQIDSSWVEVKRMLIDAYRCTVDTTDSSTPKTASVVNTSAEFRGGTNSSSYDSYLSTDVFRTQLGKPRTNVARATMRTYAKNAGSQLLNYNDYKAVLYWLPVIEFATFNIQQSFNANPTSDGYKQGGLSAGVTNMGSTNWSNYNGYNPLTPCGYANSLGNHTGVVTFTTPADSAASVTAVTHSIARWRGFENIFGDIWTNLDGILIEYNATIGKHDVYSCDNSEYFADSLNEHYSKIGEQIASDGYIGEFDLGESAEIIPSSIGGSTTTKKCDYSYQTTSAGLRILLVGGGANFGGSAGLGHFRSYCGVGLADASVGFRTSNYKD